MHKKGVCCGGLDCLGWARGKGGAGEADFKRTQQVTFTTPFSPEVLLKARRLFPIIFKDMTVTIPTVNWNTARIEEISK